MTIELEENGEEYVNAYDIPSMKCILHGKSPISGCLVRQLGDSISQRTFNCVGFDTFQDGNVGLYAINSASLMRRLVQIVDTGSDSEAEDFCRAKNIELDVFYKLKMETAHVNVAEKIALLAKVSDATFVVEYALDTMYCDIEGCKHLLRLARTVVARAEVSDALRERVAKRINLFAIYIQMKAVSSTCCDEVPWDTFCSSTISQKLQACVAAGDITSSLVLLRAFEAADESSSHFFPDILRSIPESIDLDNLLILLSALLGTFSSISNRLQAAYLG